MIRNSPRVAGVSGRRTGRLVDELDAGQARLELPGQLGMSVEKLPAIGSSTRLEIGHVAIEDARQLRCQVEALLRHRRGSWERGWSIVASGSAMVGRFLERLNRTGRRRMLLDLPMIIGPERLWMSRTTVD